MEKVCVTHVPPDGFLIVTTPNTGFDAAADYFRSKGISQREVSVGVTEVRFADGSGWKCSLEASEHFEGDSDAAVARKIDSLEEKAFGNGSHWDKSGFPLLDPSAGKKASVCRQ